MSKKKKKLFFAASSGGHLEQILMLKPLMEKYDSFLITEKTTYKAAIKNEKMYYLHQMNRKEWQFPLEMIGNGFKCNDCFSLFFSGKDNSAAASSPLVRITV